MAVICPRARVTAALIALIAASCGSSPPAAEEPPATAPAAPASPPSAPTAAAGPADGDGDTILDGDDLCPAEAEDPDAFEDHDGCPDPDNDGDAIADGDDQCPHEPETYNGTDDEDGCPDISKVVVISCPHPQPVTYVFFGKNSAKIKKTSEPILEEVVKVLEDNPQILRVQVAGHAFGEGKKKVLALSKRRAEAVVAFLEERGVSPGILSAAGYGDLCPPVQGKDKQAQQRNRSVQFFVLETDAGCVEADFACPQALAKGLVPPEDERYIPGSGYCEGLMESPPP